MPERQAFRLLAVCRPFFLNIQEFGNLGRQHEAATL
jgi:hypothetical protein